MFHAVLTIIKKEFRTFFTSATGYIVIALFLIGTALFLWVFPNQYNILDSGYASLDGLFALAPWLYLFLCPAITMRAFAEEHQQGTLEWLFTRPVSKLTVVLGKMIAGWMLVVVALLPAIIWYLSVLQLAEPAGNVDSGAFWGSFIGLILLAMLYSSVGILASALSNSQIVAFMLAAALCFVLFFGFDLIGSLLVSGDAAHLVQQFGVEAHYKSMSRGVLDSRDLLYFLLVTAVCIWATQVVLLRQKRNR
ncbi:MAG: gliding motility-associated ABC transporter permease subunit GldF [Prevotellaceae bacterium]|jgi:ABC-2 type transport system permease protein|nr:gliding motility-associated ABC transporter permease subunit GldF [Prevotellaceae bacterium]